MKSEKGITLMSVIVYVIALVIVIAVISMVTTYFYNNINVIGKNVQPSQEYTKFNSYFTQDINSKNNKVLECGNDYIVFKSGAQYTYSKENKSVYRNKVRICEAVDNLTFSYEIKSSKEVVNVTITMKDDTPKNVTYTLVN